MRINGEWLLCDDGVVRPVIRGEVQAGDGSWKTVEFLLDIGADRTVLSAELLSLLNLPMLMATEGLSGLGGSTDSVEIETKLHLRRDTGNPVAFQGRWAAVTEMAALDLCILGRDITDLFAAIIDRPDNVVCLLRQQHRYTIIQSG
jgi:hypothetical protein